MSSWNFYSSNLAEQAQKKFSNCTGREYRGHKSYVNDVKWSFSGDRLASCSRDKSVRVWSLDPTNCATKRYVDLRGHQYGVDRISWQPSCGSLELLASMSQKEVLIWDPSSNAGPVHSINHPTSSESLNQGNNVGICWRPDGKVLAVNDANNQITFYDNRSWQPLSSCVIDEEIDEISWDPTGKFLFVPCADGTVRVYDAQTGEITSSEPVSIMRGHTSNCFGVDFDADERKRVIIGSSDSLISLWDTESLICLRSFGRSSDFPVVAARFSHDGQYIGAAFTNSKFLDIIDVESGEPVHKIKTQSDVNALDWHPTQLLVVYACNDTDRYGRPDGNFRIFGLSSI